MLARGEMAAVHSLLECHYEVWRAAEAQVVRLEAELAEALQPFTTDFRAPLTVTGS